jgi:hypothetical protein
MNELAPRCAGRPFPQRRLSGSDREPSASGEVVVQRRIDAGFEIKAQERAPIMNIGADRQGGAIASTWPPTTQTG